jgi:isopentenyldiphosphate isomerase
MNPRGYWTYDKCKEEALKYKSVTEFKCKSSGAYNSSYNHKWTKQICVHMLGIKKPYGYWTFEKCQEESLKYKTRNEFFKNNGSAYNVSYKNRWLNQICSHMINTKKLPKYWTKEKCKIEALKYITRNEFQKNSKGAYQKSFHNGWLEEICSHMVRVQKPHGYWTKERCQKEALKYKTKSNFSKNNYAAYNRSYKSGWLDNICSHMIKQNNNTKRCIYSYEFPDNYVYVGLTYDIEKRQKIRDISSYDQVTKHTIESGLNSIRKQLTDYIETSEAIKLEGFYVEKYKNEGWNILNKSKTGAIGGSLKWTYDKCKEEALKYETRYKFSKLSKGAYLSAYSHNWLNEICNHMIKTQKPTSYWTKERCQEEALKYKTKTEYNFKSKGSYIAAYRKGWLNEICSHMKKYKK